MSYPPDRVRRLRSSECRSRALRDRNRHSRRAIEVSGRIPHRAVDVVVTVCDSAAADCPSWPGAKRIEHWPIEDPSWRGYEAFVETRDDLARPHRRAGGEPMSNAAARRLFRRRLGGWRICATGAGQRPAEQPARPPALRCSRFFSSRLVRI